jgi:lipopolysaccharide/colanic/teichoic acid biosynthesis glycosyltransferase
MKRTFDMLVSVISLVILFPVFIITMVAIKIGDRGPIFYKQVRVGINGKLFNILKFRSMKVDAESNGLPRWSSDNDNRITTVGKFIRQHRIDELPQLINVLCGDMSIIGPRPERPYFVDILNKGIVNYNERHCVTPGITGLAQVRYRYGSDLYKDSRKKLKYDMFYIINRSIHLDTYILFKTINIVFSGYGAK